MLKQREFSAGFNTLLHPFKEVRNHSVRLFLETAFPDGCNTPCTGKQFVPIFRVTQDIVIELLLPELDACAGS